MSLAKFCRLLVPCVALVGFALNAAAEHAFWLDPVVTYTNGMRLPSSTSQRSHNVYWQCDPNHKGSCDCQMHSSCRAALHRPSCGCGPATGPLEPDYYGHAPDGLEAVDSERVGTLTLDQPGVVREAAAPVGGSPIGAAAPPAAAPTTLVVPPNGTVWLDSIQTIGAKMMRSLGDATPAAP
ncbi:MAG: hypothetical protein ACRCT8_10255 [Lacipirellulaceae bacterium]